MTEEVKDDFEQKNLKKMKWFFLDSNKLSSKRFKKGNLWLIA